MLILSVTCDFNFCQSRFKKCYFILISISLFSDEIEHLSNYDWPFSPCELSVLILCSVGLYVFLLLICWNSLYVMYYSSRFLVIFFIVSFVTFNFI